MRPCWPARSPPSGGCSGTSCSPKVALPWWLRSGTGVPEVRDRGGRRLQPARVRVRAGAPVRLVFDRQETTQLLRGGRDPGLRRPELPAGVRAHHDRDHAAGRRAATSSPAAWGCCAATVVADDCAHGTPRPARGPARIPVTGMTCAACQSRVQRTLQQQPGVSDATVNLMMGNATVDVRPATRSRPRRSSR